MSPSGGEDSPAAKRRFGAQRLVKWVTGLFVATLSALIVGVFTDIPGQVFDLSAAKDRLRPGADIGTRLDVMHLGDQGYTMAFTGAYEPTRRQQRMMQAFFQNIEPLSLDLRRSGGVDVARLTLRLVLQGRTNQEIRVVDIRPTDVRRASPLAGTLFYIPPQEGAASIQMMLDMDSPEPVMRSVADTDEFGPVPGEPYFETNTIRLADRDEDVLVIRASALRQAVRFRLRVDYLLGGSPKTMVVDDNGKPFAITPLHCVRAGVASYQRGYDVGTTGLIAMARPQAFQVGSVESSQQTAGTALPARGHELSCVAP